MYNDAFKSATALLTNDEVASLNAISLLFERIFDGSVEEFGVKDFSGIMIQLLMEMIEYSTGDSRKTPEDFKKVLEHHFDTEGKKFHEILMNIFHRIFQRLGSYDVHLVVVAAQLKLARILEDLPKEDYKVVNGELYIRRKRRL